MRQKKVLEKISREIRDLHDIKIKGHVFHYYGNMPGSTYMGFPTSLIEKIEEDKITIDIRLRFGVLVLFKEHSNSHLTLFDDKAMKRKINRENKKKEVKT